MYNNIEIAIENLQKSKFRSKFHLSNNEKKYYLECGLDKIKSHAYDFIEKRLSPAYIENDGKQTPIHGHPVFVAQHATATCCRKCLFKWHKIKMGKMLSAYEKDYIANILLFWIKMEVEKEDL